MAYYSTSEFLAAKARESQMQLRGRTPPLLPGFSHPPEHERIRMQGLLDSIPETQPGPNAFAIQATEAERRRMEEGVGFGRDREGRRGSEGNEVAASRETRKERHSDGAPPKKQSMKESLATNPIYQRELARRRATPPTDIHPAFRQKSVSDDEPPAPRESDDTTFSEFMKAEAEESPKLKLKATPNPASLPTFRGRIEEKSEQVERDKSGSEEVRVPVFHPTPKMPAAKDFAQRPDTPGDGLQQADSGSKMPVKTPKKSIFSKFKFSANSRTADPSSANDLPADPATQAEEKVPVKAQHFLGESPIKPKGRASLGASPTKIPRSPSKRKNLFSRKNVEVPGPARPSTPLSEGQRPPNTPSTVISDRPQTAISDPSHVSYQSSRIVSKGPSGKASEAKEVEKPPMMTRSQSVKLGFYDGLVPPTPPAKNTPPHVKAIKEAKEVKEMHEAMKISTSDRQRITDDKEGAIIGTTDTISPTKFGNYGYREGPTLVTKPSMYSLHASVVPDLMEASTIEDMNARVGALDLEGFSMPTENIRRSNIAAAVYSPSTYSVDWRTNSDFASPGGTPMLKTEQFGVSDAQSAHTKGSSSNGTIPIFYPGLASDPSVAKQVGEGTDNGRNDSPLRRGRTHLAPELTWHGRTHSRHHLDGDRQSIFAHHVDNEVSKSSQSHDSTADSSSPAPVSMNYTRSDFQQAQRNSMFNSPSSFSHNSAMPSPLHYLPATVYTPPPKKEKNAIQTDAFSQQKQSDMGVKKPAGNSGLGIKSGDVSPVSSSNRDVFDDKPMLSAANTGLSGYTAQSSFKHSAYEPVVNTDPQKQPSPQRGRLPNDQFEAIVGMLNKIEARNSELVEMRDEMRVTNARLDQRLSAVETQHRDSAPPTPSTLLSQSLTGSDGQERSQVNRIPTDVAHEFYRSAQPQKAKSEEEQHQPGVGVAGRESGSGSKSTSEAASDSDAAGETGESETIRELKETNRKLMEMVSGFSDKLQVLEEKMKSDSGAG